MPTHLDLDNTRDDDVTSLPSDARDLYDRLTREGMNWRETVPPSIARIDQQLKERIVQLSAAQITASKQQPESLSSVSELSSSSHVSRVTQKAPHYLALRRAVTMLATAAVVIAFVAILSMNAGHRSSGASSHLGDTSTTSATTTNWTDLTRLDYSTNFGANDLPAIAPSNPQVVYETMAQGLQEHLPATLRATSNGGVTWHTLATPVPADHIGSAGIGVSPVNPQTIFLSLIDTTASDCPSNRLESMGEGYGQLCRLEYSSFDGGAHWSMTDLPLASGTKPGLLAASLSDGFAVPIQSNTLHAQGQRLFAGFLCIDFSCNRLVTSVDGGHTWSFADLPLLAHGAANVCDYTASQSDTGLYVVTTPTTCDFRQQVPLTLWRSVDAGATWAKVQQLASPHEQGMALTQIRTTGTTLLYMAEPVTTSTATDKMGGSYPVLSQSPSNVIVSTDGGATWQSAPTKGIPSDHAAFLQEGLLGTLSDGSVVIDVIPPSTATPGDASNFQGSDLYAWKPSDTSWRQIGSVSQEIDGLLVEHAQASPDDTIYAYLTTREDSNTFSILQKDVAR